MSKKINDSDNKFVNELVENKNDNILWMSWVKKTKRNKVQDRLVVVTKYRVFSIKRGVTKPSVQRDGLILQLVKLEYASSTQRLVLRWSDFYIDCNGPGLVDALEVIRAARQRILSSGMPLT